ncbi:MAG: DUF192 domain-containing protein [Limnobacter sp.]|nr:DUF192 domain-containing protein [Limnobacter sp.]
MLPALLVFSIAASFLYSPILQAEGLQKASIEGQFIQVEMADTPLERQKGLMFRAEMPENQGMLFRFDQAETQCMWMKNTLIDLDVAFMDKELRVINVEGMQAGTTEAHCSEKPATWALEMNRLWFAKKNIGPGAQLKLLNKTKPTKTP